MKKRGRDFSESAFPIAGGGTYPNLVQFLKLLSADFTKRLWIAEYEFHPINFSYACFNKEKKGGLSRFE